MDRISDVVASTRAGRAVAVRNRYAGAWSTRFPAIHGSGLHIIRRGSPWLLTEPAPPVLLHPGDAVFLPHGPPHGFSHEPGSLRELRADSGRTPHLAVFDVEFVSCCYHLDRGPVHESFSGLPQVVTLRLDERQPTLLTLADLLSEHAVDDRPGSDLALPAVVDLLLIHLLRAWHDQEWLTAPDPEIARVVRAVQDDPRRTWTVGELSTLARMSRAVFARRFAAATGETPGAHLLRRRLGHGADLLRHTGLPLAAIATQLGYASEFSFSAAFRREFGIAPGRFRLRERPLS